LAWVPLVEVVSPQLAAPTSDKITSEVIEIFFKFNIFPPKNGRRIGAKNSHRQYLNASAATSGRKTRKSHTASIVPNFSTKNRRFRPNRRPTLSRDSQNAAASDGCQALSGQHPSDFVDIFRKSA